MAAFSDTWREEFLTALSFLTRLPTAWLRGQPPEEPDVTTVVTLASCAWAFPLIGIVIGAAGGIAYSVAMAIDLPALAAALIAVAATVLATGGLHEDGLADTLDGFGGGPDRESKLAIMRDSRSGAYGVLALVFSVGLRAVALNQIIEGWQVLGTLIAAHALARGFLPVVLRLLEPARSDGLGAQAGRPEPNIVLWSCGIAIVIALLGVGIRNGLAAAVCAALVMAAFAWLAQRQIGGYTGDVLGAIEQMGEVTALLAIAAWAP